jgi:hypothetical protein
LARALAQATVPQVLAPHAAISMMLLPPGLFHRPSIEGGVGVWAASAARISANTSAL